MKITFATQLEGIDWIANHVENETQFEILKEELLFNYIYTERFFVYLDKKMSEVLERVIRLDQREN